MASNVSIEPPPSIVYRGTGQGSFYLVGAFALAESVYILVKNPANLAGAGAMFVITILLFLNALRLARIRFTALSAHGPFVWIGPNGKKREWTLNDVDFTRESSLHFQGGEDRRLRIKLKNGQTILIKGLKQDDVRCGHGDVRSTNRQHRRASVRPDTRPRG